MSSVDANALLDMHSFFGKGLALTRLPDKIVQKMRKVWMDIINAHLSRNGIMYYKADPHNAIFAWNKGNQFRICFANLNLQKRVASRDTYKNAPAALVHILDAMEIDILHYLLTNKPKLHRKVVALLEAD